MIKYHTGFQSLQLQAPKTKTRNIHMITVWHRQSLQQTEQIQIITTKTLENIVQYWPSNSYSSIHPSPSLFGGSKHNTNVEYCLANIKALNWEKLEFDN